MERSSLLRWLIIGVAVWLAFTYLPKLWGGKGLDHSGSKADVQPLGPESACSPTEPCAPSKRLAPTTCRLKGVRYDAVVTSQGATLQHVWLNDEQYRITNHDIKEHTKLEQSIGVKLPELKQGQPMDLVSSRTVEQRRSLRFDWRSQGVTGKNAQVAYDAFDWKLVEHDDKHCVFTYQDDRVSLRREVRTTTRPFELEVQATIKNLSDEPRTHALEVEVDAWRWHKEVESHLGRRSPFLTEVVCSHDSDVERKKDTDFEPSDFKDKEFQGDWFVATGAINFAAVTDSYFAQALVPTSPAAGSCKLQIEQRWDPSKYSSYDKDPRAGSFYRARVAYAPVSLNKGQERVYKLTAYAGPKERDVLAHAVGGTHHLSDLVDLGFFSMIARFLLQFLVWLHRIVGNWGGAIILMTLSIRFLLFPLTWKSIKSGLIMRKLKPEIDAINEKYKDDPQQKNIATMELWKKHKANPLGGCLPAIIQMPVWWALFTSLQTAVELYHTPFLWFPDLSAPDPYYIVPFVLAGTMIIQQKMMPMQMDPVQQKIMTFVMPIGFAVMMVFLPAGLSVYMITNSVLGIAQQIAVEKYWARDLPPAKDAKNSSSDDQKSSVKSKEGARKS